MVSIKGRAKVKLFDVHMRFAVLAYVKRAFRNCSIQYKTRIAEACDYFQKSTLDEIAHWKK